MHSRIFQVSSKPISEYDYITEDEAFNEELMDYCDSEVYFDDSFGWLVSQLPEGVFEVGDNTLTLINIEPLLDKWMKDITMLYLIVKAGIRNTMARYGLRKATENPLADFLFYIVDWNRRTETSDEFVDWIVSTMKPGDTIYFGKCFDYHF